MFTRWIPFLLLVVIIHSAAAHSPDSREGGEDFDTAVPIPALPYQDTGNTCNNTDDIDGPYPYELDAADVVYSLVIPEDDFTLTADLCGSAYDTQIAFFDVDRVIFAGNDDYYGGPPCGQYVSKLSHYFPTGGDLVYIVVDGYGGHCGEYILEVTGGPYQPCELAIPTGAVPEGEPELVDGYEDTYNDGCAGLPEFPRLQLLEATADNRLDLHGRSGWYDTGGSAYRDMDWFLVRLDPDGDGHLAVTLSAQEETYVSELGPHDCNEVAVLQTRWTHECLEVSLTVTGVPGAFVWLMVKPTNNHPPVWQVGHEYEYLLQLDGLADSVVRTEQRTWSNVKQLFR